MTIRVLLVEDNPTEARLVQEELSEIVDSSFEVVWVDSLSKSLEFIAERKADVIILDLSLPDSKGLETLIRVHSHASLVPIIVLTSFYDEATAIQAVQKGAQDYLFKGRIDSELLVRSIRYAIERHRVLKELERYARRLESSESRFRNIVEKNADCILVVDKNSILRFVNPQVESIFGRKAKDLVGELFNYPLVSGQTSEIEIEDSKGKLRKLEMCVVETEWEGEIVYLVTARDIAKRKGVFV